MAFLEKSNWVVLVVGVPTLLAYAALVVPQVLGKTIAEVSWVQPMLFAIVGCRGERPGQRRGRGYEPQRG